MKFNIFLIFALMAIVGCISKGRVDIQLMNSSKRSLLNASIATVQVSNNQLIINGTNLKNVTSVVLNENAIEQKFVIESSTQNEIVANGISVINLGVGKIFDLILSNAKASATFPVSFTLNNGSISAIMLSSMGALSGQVLKYNGTVWEPASLIDAQLYKGTWDPTGIIPDVTMSSSGDYWVVSVAATNPGNGLAYAIGDWIISDGYNWSKLALSKTSVSSFNGRKGLVNLIPGDYPNLKSGNKIPGSNLNDLNNIDITTIAPISGDVLKFNGLKWVAGSGGVSVVGSAEITDLSITGADIADNTINLSKIYSSSIDATLYLRGDKTWANFTAEVLNAPLSTYSLDSNTKPTVAITDKIGAALGKIQKFLNDLNTDYISKTAVAQVVSGTFSFTSPTSFLYTQLPTGISPTEVTNVQYVQNYVDTIVNNNNGYAPINLTTSSAATSSDVILNVVSTSGYPNSGTLLIGSEAIIYTGKSATSFTGLSRGAYGSSASAIPGSSIVNNYLFLARVTSTSLPKMVVTGNGNVGIGVINPNSALVVNGAIVSNSVSEVVAYIDYSKGNVQMSSTAVNTINICGMKDGGSYTLVLTGLAANTTITINAYPNYVNSSSCSGTQNAVDLSNGLATFTSGGNTNIISFVYFANRGTNGVVYGFPATNYSL